MLRTRVKICGVTRLDDALAAIDAGADALGFVFYEKSPRAISVSAAADIIVQLPAFVSKVALFVDASRADVEEVLQRCAIDLLQFHGDESAEYCASYGRPYMKALRMSDGLDVQSLCSEYHSASAILLDSYRPGTPGGTGSTFEWHRIPADLPLPLVVAGGLAADNVAQLIGERRPYAVDVSGGVELKKGVKSHALITDFMAAVRAADAQEHK
ncbi:MAG: phosphoribosylanthranilate isomerase [Spongiibacteraceae bacterium]